MKGTLAILNVAAGDTKLTFDPKNKGETRRASAVVTDMLRRGFCLLVEVGANEKGPLYQRVKEFDPATAEYIIAGEPPEETTHAQVPPGAPPRTPPRRQGRKGAARVPAATAAAVAIAPTAGG